MVRKAKTKPTPPKTPASAGPRVALKVLAEMRQTRQDAGYYDAKAKEHQARHNAMVLEELRRVGVSIDAGGVCLECGLVFELSKGHENCRGRTDK